MNEKIKDLFTWDVHYERGTLLGLIVAFIYFTFKAEPDPTLAVVYAQGNTPYGILWTLLNPLYWTNLPYSLILFTEVAVVFGLYWLLVKKHKMNKVLVELAFLSIVWLEAFHAHQNVTTIMLAPLLSLTPFTLIPMLFQRFPLGWSWNLSDSHWACAFSGSGNGYDSLINPCLSQAVRLNPFHAYSMSYVITAIWIIVPLVYWYRNHGRGVWEGITQHVDTCNTLELFEKMNLYSWFCSICGEWKTIERYIILSEVEEDDEHGFSMENGFFFEGEWFCWKCVDSCPGCELTTSLCICGMAYCSEAPSSALGASGVVRGERE